MQEFGALFDDVKFKKGLQLNFTSGKDGALITQVDNKQVSWQHFFLLSKQLTRSSRHGVAYRRVT